MGVTVLLLVRHARAEQTGKRLYGRTRGIHLSARGRAEAEDLAARLAPLSIAAIFTSPLERCMETAKAIAGGRGLRPRVLGALNEVDYGRWTGRSFPALRRTKIWERVRTSPSSVRFPDGETLAEVQHRVVDALEAIAAMHAARAVAVVTHGDAIRLALAHYAGVHLDLFARLEVAAGSVSAVALEDGRPRILRVNDTGALEDLVPARGRRVRG